MRKNWAKIGSYDAQGEFLVVDDNDIRADEMGETLQELRFDSFWASLSILR